MPANVTFLGFCGAPWTFANFMVAGHGTPDQAPARLYVERVALELVQAQDGVVARVVGVVTGRPVDDLAPLPQREIVRDADRLVVGAGSGCC